MTGYRAQGGSRGGLALTIVATELAVMFVGAILPTPLYPLYRQEFGFSGVTLTLIYAVYVLGNVTALLLFGRLADQAGRRKATVPAIGVGVAGTLAFAFAAGTPWLFVARALSGFSTGLAAGAATAWIAEFYAGSVPGAASRIAAAANFFGCAAGPLLGGLLAQFAPEPLRLPYYIYLAMQIAVAGAIAFVPETVANPQRLGDVDLTPRLGVPQRIRLQFLSPAVTGFATFALIGFYAALIPSLLREGLHLSAPTVAGGIVCELFGIAALTILSTGRLESQATMFSALAVLLPSVWLLVAAEVAQSLPLLLLAAALGGICGGLGYRGSLEVINRIAPADRRSEVVSSYLIALFAGNSVPVIGIGLLAAVAGAPVAHVTFAAMITALAGIAALTGIKYAPDKQG
ncbi:MAG TPA: MFS transporter [Xanthobacteraceae bacterium]|nr:MFS transporter [Xanthobacteraceae bacterium]